MSGPRPSEGRAAEVAKVLRIVEQWAQYRDDIDAVGLVGSWARDDADADSDIDLVFLTSDVATYGKGTNWIDLLPGAVMVKTRRWGGLTERRLVLPSGLEVDVGVTTPAWASTDPLDQGTARVIREGLRIIYDPRGLLSALAARVSQQLGDAAD